MSAENTYQGSTEGKPTDQAHSFTATTFISDSGKSSTNLRSPNRRSQPSSQHFELLCFRRISRLDRVQSSTNAFHRTATFVCSLQTTRWSACPSPVRVFSRVTYRRALSTGHRRAFHWKKSVVRTMSNVGVTNSACQRNSRSDTIIKREHRIEPLVYLARRSVRFE